MEKKHHYRNVFKSDHLGSADLEDLIENGTPLIFTITHAKQEIGVKVAGKKIDANIVYFKENIKPMVINATNGKILKKFTV
jgi:Icc-related predicted phosphoesterase